MVKVGTLISMKFSKDRMVSIRHSLDSRFQHEWRSEDVPNSAYKTEELEFIHSFIDDIYDFDNVYTTTYMPYRKDPCSGLIYLDPDNTKNTQDFIYIVVDPKRRIVFYGLYMKNKRHEIGCRNKPHIDGYLAQKKNKKKDTRRNKDTLFNFRRMELRISFSEGYV